MRGRGVGQLETYSLPGRGDNQKSISCPYVYVRIGASPAFSTCLEMSLLFSITYVHAIPFVAAGDGKVTNVHITVSALR
jgi:hypothetical protein